VLSIQNAAWIIGGTGTESAGTKWSCVRDNVTGSLSILTLGVAVTSLDPLLSKVSLTAVMTK
jgi:NhaP-type Na+/H+ and K+/H+ antiporter